MAFQAAAAHRLGGRNAHTIPQFGLLLRVLLAGLMEMMAVAAKIFNPK